MKRLIYNDLLNWKNNNVDTPLMIVGARQIGKTYIIDKFCQNEFENYVYINLMEHDEIINLYKKDISLQNKFEEMIILLNIKSDIENTILFFDEIQQSEELISALKFFNEHKLKLKIICAGSLLGVKLNRFSKSFPVGKVEILNMYPLNFEEFLMATDHELWIPEIKKCSKNNQTTILHDELLKLYNLYLCCGGMPDSIKELMNVNYNILQFKGKALDNIIFSYLADMNKYIYNKNEAIKNETIYKSIPKQLGNNNKFQYNDIEENKKSKHGKREYASSLSWLTSSKLIYMCNLVEKIEIPIEAFKDENHFKLYLNDVGLLTKLLKINYSDIVLNKNFMYKGILAENFVASELASYNIPLYFWNSKNSAEIDFLLYNTDGIIPIEVKAGHNTQSKSLKIYIEKNKPKYSIRLSTKNFGYDQNIKSIPIYSVYTLVDES